MKNWESLIAERTESHMGSYKPLRIKDPLKRRKVEYNKKWREANPDKVKIYQERNKKNVKRWAEEHQERRRELGRINDRKRAKTEKRKKWVEDYMARPEVIERRREQMKKRELDPNRIAWKKAYEEKRKNDPKRIAYRKEYNKMYHERKKKEKEEAKKLLRPQSFHVNVRTCGAIGRL